MTKVDKVVCDICGDDITNKKYQITRSWTWKYFYKHFSNWNGEEKYDLCKSCDKNLKKKLVEMADDQ